MDDGPSSHATQLYEHAVGLRRQDRWGDPQKAAMREAAVAGHPVAMFQYAVDCAAEWRYEEVEDWLTRAAAAGHPLAENELKRLQPEMKKFQATDGKALDRARVQAEQGDPEAMFRYAGQLRALNRSEANTWHERAAVAGHLEAAIWWADDLNRAGRSREAFDWYESAAKRGDATGRRRLVEIFVSAGDSRGAAFWLQRGADAGDVDSFRRLGQLLISDGHRPEGLSWLQEASNRGSVQASTDLAEIALIDGDEAAAQFWLDRCADTGWGEVYQARLWEHQGRLDEAEGLYLDLAEGDDNTLAMLFLGLLLERRGDWTEAQPWLEEASADADFGDYANRCALRVEARITGDPDALERASTAADDPALARPSF